MVKKNVDNFLEKVLKKKKPQNYVFWTIKQRKSNKTQGFYL